ncbi:MAG: hypothetical protein ABSB81_01230 [Halobacteriota archaeon]
MKPVGTTLQFLAPQMTFFKPCRKYSRGFAIEPLPSLADADLLGVFSGGAGACEYRRASLLKVAFAAKKGDNEEEVFK